jgi:hypothetical protein
MQLRPQTWLPLTMQGCVNGREWRARPMKRAGIKDEQPDLFRQALRPHRVRDGGKTVNVGSATRKARDGNGSEKSCRF